MSTIYDSIGMDYKKQRRPEPLIALKILKALRDSQEILNVGAGTGSYEPKDRRLVALEPSDIMIRQRDLSIIPVIKGVSEYLPFKSDSFDATLAILTLHHWSNLEKGLKELQRVSRNKIVILTFDTTVSDFWLIDYFPEISDIDKDTMPEISEIARVLGEIEIIKVPIPFDCCDGFLGAFWRRPDSYLDEKVRQGISVFAKISKLNEGLNKLELDLESGEWQRKHKDLLRFTELDLGYRLIIGKK